MSSTTLKDERDYDRIHLIIESDLTGNPPRDNQAKGRVWNDTSISHEVWCKSVREVHKSYNNRHHIRAEMEAKLANENAGLDRDVAPLLHEYGHKLHVGSEKWIQEATIDRLKQEIDDVMDACYKIQKQSRDIAGDIADARQEIKNREAREREKSA